MKKHLPLIELISNIFRYLIATMVILVLSIIISVNIFGQVDTSSIGYQVSERILGDLTFPDYIASYIFAGCGLFLRWCFTSYLGVKKNKNIEGKPNRFNLVYWLENNLIPKIIALISTAIVIFIAIRFAEEMEMTFSFYYAFGLGLGLDFVVDKIKRLIKKGKDPKETDTKE